MAPPPSASDPVAPGLARPTGRAGRGRALAMAVALLAACSTVQDDPAGRGDARAAGEDPESPRSGTGAGREAGSPAQGAGEAKLVMAAPPAAVKRCTTLPSHTAVCPSSVPRIDDGTPVRVQSFSQVGGHRVVSLEWSAPFPGVTAKNSPPRYAHVVIQSGRGSPAFPFEVPTDRPRGAVRLSRRRQALGVGHARWAGRPGTLLLAPSYPAGGVHGDHLVLLWRRAPMTYAVSLHAWPPLRETKRTLRAIVESIAPGDE